MMVDTTVDGITVRQPQMFYRRGSQFVTLACLFGTSFTKVGQDSSPMQVIE